MLSQVYEKSIIQTVFDNGILTIQSISNESMRSYDRLMAYKQIFTCADHQRLDDYDGGSQHYEVWDKTRCLGGFRLTPIGGGRSEIEEVFTEYIFVPGSFELGRLWATTLGVGDGKKCMIAISQWLLDKNVQLYFKQSSALGEVSKLFGAVCVGIYKWNPRLKYKCELFSWRSNNDYR